jgi:hypothetical protein
MLLEGLAAMALLSQTQEASCGWEAGRWVCRTPAPVTQPDPNAATRGMREGYESARRIDEARRARAAQQAYNPPPPVYSSPQQADLDALPRAPITPNDLYVGCYLLVRDANASEDSAGRPESFSPEMCGFAAILAIRDREGIRPDQDRSLLFCLPTTSEVAANPGYAMAHAYLDFYDLHTPQRHTQDGMLAFTAAMIDKWPCEA